MTEQFDVFLAHNSVDKPLVREIGARLRERGLNPWLDEEQIAPGELFQEAIQRAIPNIKSAAIIIGASGLGQWQVIELHTLTSQFVEQGIKVIPVLLPGVTGLPEKLLFLRQFNWVSFKDIKDDDAFYRFEWGITGKKPQLTNSSQSSPASQSPPLSVPQSRQSFIETLSGNIKLEMIKIPAGSFLMGTEEAEVIRLCQEYKTDWFKCEMPQHRVNLKEFYLGKYPVTQEQYQAIMGNNPSNFKDNPKNPVEKVSWNDAQKFCQKLNEKTGKKYRLPSEAEWEYACRAGTTTSFYFGETISTDQANYDGNYTFGKGKKGVYREKTTPVGSFPANKFGLYDMHGNVWEWCQDVWHENYENAPKDGSNWNDNHSQSPLRLLRGGSWDDNPGNCRSAIRYGFNAGYCLDNIGFRLAVFLL
jgi:formylglycine-generating enzyme required for sulfatase activity